MVLLGLVCKLPSLWKTGCDCSFPGSPMNNLPSRTQIPLHQRNNTTKHKSTLVASRCLMWPTISLRDATKEVPAFTRVDGSLCKPYDLFVNPNLPAEINLMSQAKPGGYETLLVERRERVAIITINRPDQRNALNI